MITISKPMKMKHIVTGTEIKSITPIIQKRIEYKDHLLTSIDVNFKVLDDTLFTTLDISQSIYYKRLNNIFLNGIKLHKEAIIRADIHCDNYYEIMEKICKQIISLREAIQYEEQKLIAITYDKVTSLLLANIYKEKLFWNGYQLIDRHKHIITEKMFDYVRRQCLPQTFNHVDVKSIHIYKARIDELYEYWKSKKGSTRVLEKSRV